MPTGHRSSKGPPPNSSEANSEARVWYIAKFSSNIVHTDASQNITADSLSQMDNINDIAKSITISSSDIADAQHAEPEL